MNHHALHPRGAIALVVIGALLALVFALSAVPAQAAVFSNSGPIAVPGVGTGPGQANPYPSAITISGLAGTITNVDVTLTRASHTFPSDIDVLLVGPSGENVVLMADVGGSTDITNVILTFDDAALTTVPATIVPGTYRPTTGAFDGTPPAPVGPYGNALSVFNGTSPNGTWKLFVFDDAAVDSGANLRWLEPRYHHGWAGDLVIHPAHRTGRNAGRDHRVELHRYA